MDSQNLAATARQADMPKCKGLLVLSPKGGITDESLGNEMEYSEAGVVCASHAFGVE